MTDPLEIGVIFDMDGVLVDSATPHFRSWQMLGEHHGVNVTQDQFGATFGRQNKDIVPLLFGPVSADRAVALADRKEAIYRDLILAEPPIADGAVDLVRALHRHGVALAIGSSGPLDNIRLVVDAMGIGPCLAAVVSGDDVTRGKPDPQVFVLAAERLGMRPARTVVIEDAPVGIQAAKAAGAKAIAVTTYHHRAALGHADLIVDALTELDPQRILDLLTG